MNLTEAFKALDNLEEDVFSVNDEGIEKLQNFIKNDDSVDELSVYDLELEDEREDTEDCHVGDTVLDCCVCHSKLFKPVSEVIIDNETQVANKGEECPYCYSVDGFKVVGEVTPFEDTEDIEVEVKDTGDELEEAVGGLKCENKRRVFKVSEALDGSNMITMEDLVSEGIDLSDLKKQLYAKLDEIIEQQNSREFVPNKYRSDSDMLETSIPLSQSLIQKIEDLRTQVYNNSNERYWQIWLYDWKNEVKEYINKYSQYKITDVQLKLLNEKRSARLSDPYNALLIRLFFQDYQKTTDIDIKPKKNNNSVLQTTVDDLRNPYDNKRHVTFVAYNLDEDGDEIDEVGYGSSLKVAVKKALDYTNKTGEPTHVVRVFDSEEDAEDAGAADDTLVVWNSEDGLEYDEFNESFKQSGKWDKGKKTITIKESDNQVDSYNFLITKKRYYYGSLQEVEELDDYFNVSGYMSLSDFVKKHGWVNNRDNVYIPTGVELFTKPNLSDTYYEVYEINVDSDRTLLPIVKHEQDSFTKCTSFFICKIYTLDQYKKQLKNGYREEDLKELEEQGAKYVVSINNHDELFFLTVFFTNLEDAKKYMRSKDYDKAQQWTLLESTTSNLGLVTKKGSIANLLAEHIDELQGINDVNELKNRVFEIVDNSDIANTYTAKQFKHRVSTQRTRYGVLGTIGAYMYGKSIRGTHESINRKSHKLGKYVVESDNKEETIGDKLKKYQMWVDYDMEHYGKVSETTQDIIDKEGLQLIKDEYGDYEVSVGHYKSESFRKSKKGKYVKEDIDEIEISSDDMEIKVKPKDEECEECEEETVSPVSEETIDEIEINNVDKDMVDEVTEECLKENFNNVKFFRSNNITKRNNKLIVEGVIGFKSGKKKNTKFMFESYKTNRDKVVFLGENKDVTKNKSLSLVGKVVRNKFISESMKLK